MAIEIPLTADIRATSDLRADNQEDVALTADIHAVSELWALLQRPAVSIWTAELVVPPLLTAVITSRWPQVPSGPLHTALEIVTPAVVSRLRDRDPGQPPLPPAPRFTWGWYKRALAWWFLNRKLS
jgi:hypothetical protein